MKKLFLTFSCMGVLFTLYAQTFYGTTFNGGVNGRGTLSKYATDAGTLAAAFTFETPDGIHPQFSGLVQAADGKLYGMTRYGGTTNYGVLFSFNPATATYTKLYNFDNTNGAYPYGNLTEANGKLYGMTTYGGAANMGVIFCYDPATATYTKLKDLGGVNGARPYGSFTLATDGKLYAMTSYGGNRNAGVIFCFNPLTAACTKLKDFDGGNGGSPYGNLMAAADGKLYGMTCFGGSKGHGVIFCFATATNLYTKLTDFDNVSGGNPYGSLVQTADGKLFGLTYQGGVYNKGVVFSFNPATALYTKLKDLNAVSGYNPYGSLVLATDGALYGTTSDGGSNNAGVVFSFNPSTTTYSKLKDLLIAEGSNPQTSLVQASNGKLYSMTTNGGNGGNGVIFCFDINNALYTKVKDFGSNNYGSDAVAGTLQVGGKMYGMTNTGGSNGVGSIYAYDLTTLTMTSVYNFDNTNGGNPYGSLVQGTDGNLYGTTYSGGLGYGVLFSYNAATADYNKLYAFDYASGGNPTGNVIQTANGKLYGMTTYGGNNGAGVLFSYDLTTLQYKKLFDFGGNSGAYPYGSLMQATDGKLYGMTTYGGNKGMGVLFSYDPVNAVYTKLKEFTGVNGSYPYGSLLQTADGKLYGLTSNGGTSNAGVIFSYAPATATITKRKDFDSAGGSNPYGSLMQAANGTLYGVTNSGGIYNKGVIFSFTTARSTYTKLQDYNGSNGSNPQYVTLMELRCIPVAYYQDADGDSYGNINSKIMACTPPAGYVTDSTDCNDADTSIRAPKTYYEDVDGDGYGNAAVVINDCSPVPPTGYAANVLDCNDEDATIYPGATETADDGIDQDCDGADLKTWYADADGDGYGNAGATTTANTQPANYVADNADCNDTEPGIHAPNTFYADTDTDGYGNSASTIQACLLTPPSGYSANSTDCNDSSNIAYPGAPELCDGIDNNCDGAIDEGCALPKLKINNVSQIEGNSNTQNMVFTVTITPAATRTTTVEYKTKNATALSSTDYVLQTGTLTFAPGVKTQTITIVINGDVEYETDETFKVILGNPVNATLGDNTGIGTILNDDVQAVKLTAATAGDNNMHTLHVSPNPANDVLNVKVYGFAGSVSLRLINLRGKVLKEAAMQTGVTKYIQHKFPVSTIASGTYFLIARDNMGNQQTQKVVIVH